MIRITVSYPAAPGARFDHDYYQTKHRALLLAHLAAHGMQRVEMDRPLADGAGGPPPIAAAAHLLFETLDGFKAGMASHGLVIMADVATYTDLKPLVLISEVA